MTCKRSALIELIEEVDQIHVDSCPVIMELIQWLPTSTIESFIEDAKQALELDYDRAEDYFVNKGIKARESMKTGSRLCAPSIHTVGPSDYKNSSCD
jgi:hypothetical protein